MDRLLVEAARDLYAENLFETVRKCYCEANKEYLGNYVDMDAVGIGIDDTPTVIPADEDGES